MSASPVIFVGAGPGAEDLLTLRGLRALEEADLVIHAGSLVNPALLRRCGAECRILDSAGMDLEEQVSVMADAALAGRRVVRLHTGDPSVFGAINEQIRALAERGVETRIVPGVSSVFAAAAALGCELTEPDVSQAVTLARAPGRTPVPEGESPAGFARAGGTLAFFLSAGMAESLTDELMRDGGLPPDTPSAAVHRASWPDERVLRGALADIAPMMREAGMGRQAIILVGRALAARGGASRLYDASFSHGRRNRLADEAFDGSCALYAFTDQGLVRAREIAAGLGLPSLIRCARPVEGEDVVFTPGAAFDSALEEQWRRFDAHIFIGATGIAVRKIAPLLRDKTADPAVVVCDERGIHVVALTSGHIGGAGRLARRVARIVGGEAVVGAGTDVNGLPAFDDVAALEGARILNTDALRAVNAALLAGEPTDFCGPRDVFDRRFAGADVVRFRPHPEEIDARHAVIWDAEGEPPAGTIRLDVTSRAFVLGIGCRRGVDADDVRRRAEAFLMERGLHPGRIAMLASCDVKADEPAILRLAEAWGVPIRWYDAASLDAVDAPHPSAKVRERVGSGSVCEAACLLAAGRAERPRSGLAVPKTVLGDLTLALARLPHASSADAARGGIVVAGLGSGAPGQITPEAETAIRRSDVVAGYAKYLDMIPDLLRGKDVIRSGMTEEVARCRAALEAAAAGRRVCVVCSGDPGILAMAGLLFELRARDAVWKDVPIRVLPGVTAASIAAASLGAPLQNGFVLLSLSDLLVPAEEVRRNLRAAAASALPVAIYNPAGRKRRSLLAEALEAFRAARGDDAPCAFVRHAGREREEKWLGRLADLPEREIDMSSLIIVGGPRTIIGDGLMYEARGYAEKHLED